jgi:ABC-2 type transport system permease protein
MRALWKLIVIQAKLFIREPIGAFFTLAFAPLLLILFGFIWGNDPVPEFGGFGPMDVSVPAYVGLIVATVGLMSVPIATSARRETGALRRFKATPLRPLAYMISDVAVNFVMTVLGISILMLVGKLVYNVRFEGNLLSVFAAVSLGAFAFFAIGYVITGLAPTARAAQIVGMVLLYPMMFLSGAAMPIELLPEGVQNFSRFLPLSHVVKLVRGLWIGDTWGQHTTEVIVLLGVLIVGTAISVRTFKWE